MENFTSGLITDECQAGLQHLRDSNATAFDNAFGKTRGRREQSLRQHRTVIPVADLRRIATTTPYTPLIIVGVSRQLLVWGWKQGESKDLIKACANAAAGVGADGDYSDNPHFLNGLEERDKLYLCAVRCDFSVTLSRGLAGPVERADEVIAAQRLREWETISWREGSRGRLRAKFIALRCWRVEGDGARHLGWLIGERPARGQHGDWKYDWSNFPPRTSLEKMVEYAHRRHRIEQYLELGLFELYRHIRI